MTVFSGQLYLNQTLWAVVGVFSILTFFAGVVILALMLRQKRKAGSIAALLSALLSCALFQGITSGLHAANAASIPAMGQAADSLDWLIVLVWLVLVSGEAILFISILTHRNRITPMSIKEATDSLPMGILCYAPNGKILLVNTMMEHFCKMLLGDSPSNGTTFSKKLYARTFLPGCQVIDEKNELVIRIPNGTAWTVAEEMIPYDGIEVHAFMVSDITDVYRKTVELRKIQEQTQAANVRLVKINQEIIALTAEQELLDAQVRIHDEMGSNLLSIKRFILHGGTEAEKAEIEQRVRENIGFLKEKADVEKDEYKLMIDTAKRLGVDVMISGALPQTEPLKKIISTGIHECFTNILRHAHGDRLDVRITEKEDRVVAVFTNNGEPPKEEIKERGGLVLLRSLTEQAGGRMTVCSTPELSITLELPKEANYAVSGVDRRRSDYFKTII